MEKIHRRRCAARSLTYISHTEAERQHPFERLARVLRIRATQRRIATQPIVGHLARPLDRVKITDQMDKTKRQRSGLARSQQISRPAQLQIGLCDSGSSDALAHELKACEPPVFRVARGHKAASRRLFAPP